MTDLCHEIANRSRVAAYVLGNGTEYALFWLHARAEDEEIRECARRGFNRCGVIGLVGEKIVMVSRYGTESLMESARDDFELALMQRGASVN